MTSLSVINTPIRRDADGRYSLNDLHKAAVAAGANKRTKEPAKFLATPSAQAIINEVVGNNKCENPVVVVKGHRGGTFASKEITLMYAMWIGGPKFTASILSKLHDASSIIEALNDFEVPEECGDMYVYAIREAETGRIKLGISKNPEARLKQLQTGNSQRLELVAYKKASNKYNDEKSLHLINCDKHIRGEWFSESASF